MTNAVRTVAILPIRLYQKLISPFVPPNTCKYHPELLGVRGTRDPQARCAARAAARRLEAPPL